MRWRRMNSIESDPGEGAFCESECAARDCRAAVLFSSTCIIGDETTASFGLSRARGAALLDQGPIVHDECAS
jgi:hypothetical protein